jgi:ABC-type nitrate/sulfonate/bicarbonate transport system ATPase subunit
VIQLNNLVVGYDKPLMKPLNYKFEDGKIYGILGKSGCGKSSLLRTIARMNKEISGQVTNENKDHIYMMHQRYTNFDWLTCLDNVLIAERNRRKRKELRPKAVEVLRRVGLEEYLDRYPTELSGGMQQRLALARVMFVKPAILLMDEPLSALDDSTRVKMQQLIMDTHKETGNTIIMVTHSVDEAEKMCDQIIKLDSEVLK